MSFQVLLWPTSFDPKTFEFWGPNLLLSCQERTQSHLYGQLRHEKNHTMHSKLQSLSYFAIFFRQNTLPKKQEKLSPRRLKADPKKILSLMDASVKAWAFFSRPKGSMSSKGTALARFHAACSFCSWAQANKSE